MAKILSLDIGAARVGVALGDDRDGYVVTKPALSRHSDEQLLSELQAMVRTDEISLVLVGLPLTLRGETSDQTKSVQAFADRLRQRLSVPVQMADERFTTKLAHAAGRTKDDDSAAAAFLLQTYLEQQTGRKTP